MLMMLMAAVPMMMAPQVLQAQVEAFAGAPAMVDPQLLLPACEQPVMAFAAGGRSVMVQCAMPAWQVFVPVRVQGESVAVREVPLIRRGDRVVVEVEGAGFVVGMEAVAEADARDGRVPLRPVNGGRRLIGMVDAQGGVKIRGLNSMVNGR